jgi:hypothetical protein
LHDRNLTAGCDTRQAGGAHPQQTYYTIIDVAIEGANREKRHGRCLRFVTNRCRSVFALAALIEMALGTANFAP